jgi:hypothetical protein
MHDFDARLRNALRLAVAARAADAAALERVLFVLPNLLDSLCHAAVLRRPARLSLAAAKEEILCAMLAYLSAAL